EELAYQEPAPGVEVLGRPRIEPTPNVHWMRDARERVLASAEKTRGSAPPHALGMGPAVSGSGPAEVQAAVTLLGPARWLQPDQGLPVTVLTNSLGEPLAPSLGFSQVHDALAAWSGVSGSSFAYADGGPTSAAGFRLDGVSAVSFRDPLGQIDPPTNCGGT